ncbi:MAG: hypothetical protein K8R60_04445 [Burkholderiales bacterium]|nr:hypothetical protein [Burkholderiales bacterium]
MRVVASHQHRRRATVADAREAVLEAAQRTRDGTGGPDTASLVARLEKVTGAGIAELAMLAKDWPDA